MMVPEQQVVKVQVWDTAGQERYRAITSAYYRDAVGAIIVYDITKEDTYNSVVRWVKDVRNNTNNRDINIMLGEKKYFEEPTNDVYSIKSLSWEQVR